ncbi:TonB-dependent receptor [Rhodohalobacter sp. 614A]|uniref:TonB-dependent receptor n=1 Tax=Rhodohalobacter sp. 614A TaxID=2908649 RepID=UPI001F357ACB|nr:TonB-dependent receptor plug domain-containing protein [Rhodohalobacter sp. 614A]
MKTFILLSLISLSLLVAGCSSVGSSVAGQNNDRPEGSVSDDNDYFTSLADYLQKVPGVNINSGVVTIRGYNSFDSRYSPITPLFVIDGNAIGYSYNEANKMVDPRYIDYVRVLKGPDAAIYGVRGGNGVVEIVTRKI